MGGISHSQPCLLRSASVWFVPNSLAIRLRSGIERPYLFSGLIPKLAMPATFSWFAIDLRRLSIVSLSIRASRSLLSDDGLSYGGFRIWGILKSWLGLLRGGFGLVSAKVQSDGWEFWVHQASSRVGVVLVHEIFGHDEYIESVASKLAEEGVSAAAVDLYRGQHPSSLEDAFKVRASLKEEQVVDALRSGSRVLKERLGGEAKVGSMGFCMGGGFALLGACKLPLAFCVDYYGMLQQSGRR